MTELFRDLYRYRQRENKENREDWLTECLAAVLRGLPKESLAAVLAQLTGQPRELIVAVGENLSIITQITIERGADGSGRQRPDMLISVNGQPWLLFENKVSHPVDQVERDDGKLESQLHRYGEWLSRQKFSVHGLRPALVFVTHHTPVPVDFADSHSQHDGLGRHCSTWGHVGRILDDATSELDATLHARALVRAYIAYLEEYRMADDYPAYKDLAGLGMFIDKADSYCKLVDGMMERMGGLCPFAGHVVRAKANSDEGTFVSYRYLRPEDRFGEETFVATGIWFPDLADGWYRECIEDETGEPVSPSPKVYLQLANDEDDALGQLAGLPGEGWLRLNSDFFVFRDFASFPGDPTERAIAIFAWLDAECAKLKALLAA